MLCAAIKAYTYDILIIYNIWTGQYAQLMTNHLTHLQTRGTISAPYYTEDPLLLVIFSPILKKLLIIATECDVFSCH